MFKTWDIVTNKEYTESVFYQKPYTMINFWSTTCGPCIVELPYIQECAGIYSSKLTVLTVLYNSGVSGAVEDAKRILAAYGITLPVLRMNDSMKDAFTFPHLITPSLPTTFFIDGNGKFIAAAKGNRDLEEWKELIESMINKGEPNE